jgi:hypothetical protein
MVRLMAGLAVMAGGLWAGGRFILPLEGGAWWFLAASYAVGALAFLATRPEAPARFAKVLLVVWICAYPAGLWKAVIGSASCPVKGAIILALVVVGPIVVGEAYRPLARRLGWMRSGGRQRRKG